ncbi:MAG: flagellar basal body L-ring protein FlgH [candidate division Zixibacteria bacterium]|nr:flagellar basal body L-ring protein FlgH [candidate division Zixibacteria bacterium]
MSIRKIIFFIIILLLLPFSLKVWAGDFGQGSSLFTDIKAHKVGDILTVLVYEASNATSQAETKTEKAGKFSTEGGPGSGSLRFIPFFGASGENKNSFNGKGENTRAQTLRAKMSVTIVGAKENGDLIIKGSRTVGVSKDNETMTLTGVVRQKDITAANTIDSYLIADANISYTGKGAANTSSRPGPIIRFLNWIF